MVHALGIKLPRDIRTSMLSAIHAAGSAVPQSINTPQAEQQVLMEAVISRCALFERLSAIAPRLNEERSMSTRQPSSTSIPNEADDEDAEDTENSLLQLSEQMLMMDVLADWERKGAQSTQSVADTFSMFCVFKRRIQAIPKVPSDPIEIGKEDERDGILFF
jgi:hypothetical protein